MRERGEGKEFTAITLPLLSVPLYCSAAAAVVFLCRMVISLVSLCYDCLTNETARRPLPPLPLHHLNPSWLGCRG